MAFQKFRSNRLRQNISAVSIGVLAFLYFANWRFLNFRNIGWLFSGANTDKAQAYLGWEFYRQSPWTLPLGRSEGFGLLKSNSITYSDSIPLFAIPLKLFSKYYVDSFQYFGFWLLLCFILQSLFTALIVRQFSENFLLITSSCCLMVTIPFFLQRTPIHLALSGHFLILASIYLFLKSRRQPNLTATWFTLVVASLLIHPYLFVMVFAIYITNLMDLKRNTSRKWNSIILELLSCLLAVVLLLWLVLGIKISSRTGLSSQTYGTYPWNTLSIVNPRDWPKFLGFYPARDSGFDTFSYPGLGNLLIISLASLLIFKNSRIVTNTISKVAPLAVGVMFLLVFAITNRIGIGDFRIVIFESEFIEKQLSIFRVSARMAWPFLYLLILFSIFTLAKVVKRKVLILVLVISLAFQFADVRQAPQFLFQQKGISLNAEGPTIDPFWEDLPKVYKRILVVQEMNEEFIGWPDIAIIANRLDLETNSAYLARYDIDEYRAINSRIRNEVESGNLDEQAIYVIYNEVKVRVPEGSSNYTVVRLGGKLIVLPQGSS